MGEKTFPASLRNGSSGREAEELRQEIADIREQLGREIAELDRRRVIALAKAKKYAVMAGATGLGAGAVLTIIAFIARTFFGNKQASKG